jgi:DNA adenine methylase
MYVDPPYYLPPKNKHYRHGLDKEDHLRLCQALKKTKHKFFLTYDNAEQIKNLYSWANIFPVDFFYRVGNSASQQGSRRKGFELIITNFDLDEVLLK